MDIRKIIKEETSDFDWASEVPASKPMPTNETKYEHLDYDIMSRMLENIKYTSDGVEWDLSIDTMSGALYWTNTDVGFMIYATPHFGDHGEVPVALFWYEGEDYETVGEFEVPRFTYVSEAEDWYRDVYPEKVLEMALPHTEA